MEKKCEVGLAHGKFFKLAESPKASPDQAKAQIASAIFIAQILALAVALICAVAEKGAQSFSPYRTVDVIDLTCDLAGMVFFQQMNKILIKRNEKILESARHES